ncbi:hypothetical protein OCHUTO_0930 [Orientia chuto str. Dubai]|uniref:Uncharacterized protein n=1 Tax=Orientia chuto str. Dubai TaxID=1359168 RepID=A0A0F3MIB4_9RICK|nr:hypothetical protein [Candidatus Orientia mediorientalis]KJV55197.1 hypothetical protein OCHUTO_0930 [Orientia chuto str. Dubai]
MSGDKGNSASGVVCIDDAMALAAMSTGFATAVVLGFVAWYCKPLLKNISGWLISKYSSPVSDDVKLPNIDDSASSVQTSVQMLQDINNQKVSSVEKLPDTDIENLYESLPHLDFASLGEIV